MTISQGKPIGQGQRIPDAELTIMTDDGPDKRAGADFFSGRKVVLFAVPGAFTPTCHNSHMPGFVENAGAMRERGVDEVAVVAVNDPFVMGAWSKASEAGGKVTFIADGNGDFTRALGMDMDLSMAGFGTRSKRYAMIVDDGTVAYLGVEDGRGVTHSSAASVMENL